MIDKIENMYIFVISLTRTHTTAHIVLSLARTQQSMLPSHSHAHTQQQSMLLSHSHAHNSPYCSLTRTHATIHVAVSLSLTYATVHVALSLARPHTTVHVALLLARTQQSMLLSLSRTQQSMYTISSPSVNGTQPIYNLQQRTAVRPLALYSVMTVYAWPERQPDDMQSSCRV
jgi:GDP-D-mannose dehydratase